MTHWDSGGWWLRMLKIDAQPLPRHTPLPPPKHPTCTCLWYFPVTNNHVTTPSRRMEAPHTQMKRRNPIPTPMYNPRIH